MKKLLSVAASAALAITGLAIAPQTASADIRCTSTLSGTHNDNIHVPAGSSCTLNNINLDGDVKLARNASVTINGGRIDGNVQAEEGAKNVIVRNVTWLDGDIQVKYATGTVNIEGNTLDGNIQLAENKATISVVNNVLDGDLQCKANSPAPTGGGNKADSYEGQCRGFDRPVSGGGGGPVNTDPNVDIYITPGKHNVNGRQWNTVCGQYSSQVHRCTTNIVATQITYDKGRFVKRTGEVFNNLTYKASPRSQWANNPLGGYGKVRGSVAWTAEDGRKWRTECDTTTTGRGGCRNYVTADVIEERNGRYRVVKNKEVFNSMVRFS